MDKEIEQIKKIILPVLSAKSRKMSMKEYDFEGDQAVWQNGYLQALSDVQDSLKHLRDS